MHQLAANSFHLVLRGSASAWHHGVVLAFNRFQVFSSSLVLIVYFGQRDTKRNGGSEHGPAGG